MIYCTYPTLCGLVFGTVLFGLMSLDFENQCHSIDEPHQEIRHIRMNNPLEFVWAGELQMVIPRNAR